MSRQLPFLLLFTVVLFLGAPALRADENAGAGATTDSAKMRDLIEQEKIAEAVIRETTAELKQSGELPRTPLQLMVLLAEAGDAGNWERAGAALDMRYLPEELEGWPAAELIQALGIVWSQQNIVDITQLSDQPEGHLDDGLPSYRDLLGVVLKDDGTEVPIFLQRIPDGRAARSGKSQRHRRGDPGAVGRPRLRADRRVAAAPSSGLSFRGYGELAAGGRRHCSSSPPGIWPHWSATC
jgi:MscS family membrane protein